MLLETLSKYWNVLNLLSQTFSHVDEHQNIWYIMEHYLQFNDNTHEIMKWKRFLFSLYLYIQLER